MNNERRRFLRHGFAPAFCQPGPPGLLPFDFDASDATDEVTGRAGLPLLLETMMALHSSGGTIAKLGASKSSTMW